MADVTEEQQKHADVHVARYPGVLTDWHGRALHRKILRLLQPGNIVRIPVQSGGGGGRAAFSQVFYFRITQHCKGHAGLFRGKVEDPYYGRQWHMNGQPMYLLENGAVRVFRADDVMEIPLDWSGNARLRRAAEFIPDKGRSVTGAL